MLLQKWDVINRIWDEEAGFEIVFPSSAAHSRVHTHSHTPEGLPEGWVGVCARGGEVALEGNAIIKLVLLRPNKVNIAFSVTFWQILAKWSSLLE